VAENRPSPVVETPAHFGFDRKRGEQFLNAASQLRIARRRVLDVVQFAREPAEIVNRARRVLTVTAAPGTYQ
jgi:hypothetical protein